jgi:hypothetical protein
VNYKKGISMNNRNSKHQDKTTLILHIGGPKCGSSALQNFLTHEPNLQTPDGRKFEYWTVNSDIKFNRVHPKTFTDEFSYSVSAPLEDEFKTKCIHNIFGQFIQENSAETNKIFVFSWEGWSQVFQNPGAAKCICNETNFEVIIYLSVRPQVDILVSTYLQWTMWGENPTLEQAVKDLTEFADWEKQTLQAYELGANQVNVRYTSNVVTDFCQLYRIDTRLITRSTNKRINKSLPIEALTLLTKNRQLRPGEHDSFIDFIIEDYIYRFEIPTTKVNLTIGIEILEKIEDYFSPGNSRILGLMENAQAFAFAQKSVESKNVLLLKPGIEDLTAQPLSIEFLEKLCVAMLIDIQGIQISRDTALAERDAVVAERDAVVAERDAVVAERDAVINSNSWRLLKVYRRLKSSI